MSPRPPSFFSASGSFSSAFVSSLASAESLGSSFGSSFSSFFSSSVGSFDSSVTVLLGAAFLLFFLGEGKQQHQMVVIETRAAVTATAMRFWDMASQILASIEADFAFGCCNSSSSFRMLNDASVKDFNFAGSVAIAKLSKMMPPCIVQMSMPTESILGKRAGVWSSKNSGFAICFGFQTPLYSGLSIFGGDHLPLYLGLEIGAGSHLPHPTLHAGLSIIGGSHSPSSSSSQSSGFLDSGSKILF
mmetsp:Transcript_53619/g.96347  ORF Transcript_53619/g.96347 Transcript_53619/m.96347 type:complete len:245 (+) Transcript_53619:154-888(+)